MVIGSRKSAAWLLFHILILAFYQLSVQAQKAPRQPVPNENFRDDRFLYYSLKDGLSNNYVFDIQQDSRGLVWLGTGNGLNRFDGRRFQVYDKRDEPPFYLSRNAIWQLKHPDASHLAIPQGDGIHLIDTRSFKTRRFFVPDTSYFSYYINQTLDAVTLPSGMVGFVSLSGFYVIDSLGKPYFRFDRFKAGDEKTDRVRYGEKILRMSDEELLVVGKDSAVRAEYYHHSSKTIRKTEPSDPDLGVFAPVNRRHGAGYLKWEENSFLILHYGNRLVWFDRKSRKTFECPLPFKDWEETGWQTMLCRLNDSTLAFNSMKGGFFLAYLNQQKERILIDTTRYLPDKYCFALLNDREGRLWVGTSEGFLVQKKDRPFSETTELELSAGNRRSSTLTAVHRHGNRLYIGTSNSSDGLIVADTAGVREIHRIAVPKSLDAGNIFSIYGYHRDTLWIGTDNGLVWLSLPRESWGFVKDQAGKPLYPNDDVMVYPPDAAGNIWILNMYAGMLSRYNQANRTFHHMTTATPDPLPFKRISHILYDAYGDIWFSGEGLARWNSREQRIDTLIREFGDRYDPDFEIVSCTADEKGSLWLNVQNTLFEYRIKDRKFVRHTPSGIPEIIQDMPFRMYGRILWFTALDRIYGYEPSTGQLRYFDYRDSSISAMGAGWIYHDRESNSYYASSYRYIHKFTGIPPVSAAPDRSLHITGVETPDSIYYYPENRVVLERPVSGFLVRFTIPDYNPYQTYTYYYKIGESDWIGPAYEQSVYFNTGTYGANPIAIKAVDKYGTDYITSLDVVIPPPWWQTTAFRISLIVLLAAGAYGVFRYRLKEQVRLKETQIRASIQAQEKERERFSKDLHDGVGASLSMLKMYLSSFDNLNIPYEELRDRSRKLLDGSVEEIRRLIHDMHPRPLIELGLAGALRLMVQQAMKGNSPDISLEVDGIPAHMDKITEINLYRIFQELLQNTLKHAAATQVSISAESRADRLLFHYRDNGMGFDTDKVAGGNGLLNIQNRVMLLKGTLLFHSAKGAGVDVRIEVPLTAGEKD